LATAKIGSSLFPAPTALFMSGELSSFPTTGVDGTDAVSIMFQSIYFPVAGARWESLKRITPFADAPIELLALSVLPCFVVLIFRLNNKQVNEANTE
jgi:hypothetical protein